MREQEERRVGPGGAGAQGGGGGGEGEGGVVDDLVGEVVEDGGLERGKRVRLVGEISLAWWERGMGVIR